MLKPEKGTEGSLKASRIGFLVLVSLSFRLPGNIYPHICAAQVISMTQSDRLFRSVVLLLLLVMYVAAAAFMDRGDTTRRLCTSPRALASNTSGNPIISHASGNPSMYKSACGARYTVITSYMAPF